MFVSIANEGNDTSIYLEDDKKSPPGQRRTLPGRVEVILR
jgi:hypothetical protein